MRLLKMDAISDATGMVYAGRDDPDYQGVRAACIAQRAETLKEVGDEMMKMSTLQEFHALRVRLIQGKLEEK